jgi:CheY-like chemotaxis protein
VPVSYRVWVSGFADDERDALAPVFARRSLIAYTPTPTPGEAQLVLADADRPQLAGGADGPPPGPSTTLWVGHLMPPGARWHVPRPVDATLVMRTFDELVACERPAPDRIVDAFDALWQRVVVAAGTRGAEPPAETARGPRAAVPSAIGDRRRHLVPAQGGLRRALRGLPARGAGRGTPAGTDPVLVLDPHPASRVETGVLLQAFGFRVVAVDSLAEAERALWTRPFALALLAGGASEQATAAIALCQRIKHGSCAAPGRPLPKVVVRTGHPREADPVRARLAGCDHFVAGEASRGVLALALEAVELPMPSDPRRRR